MTTHKYLFRSYQISLLLLATFTLSAQEQFVKWLDDDRFILSRMEGTSRQLYQMEISSGRQKRWEGKNERRRSHRNDLSLGDGSIIQKLSDDLFLVRADGTELQLTRDSAEEKNPRLSFDKQKIAYTKEHDLYVFNITKGIETRLTFDGSGTIYNGWASWVYYEEILGRSSNYAAFWWSPDSRKIAFLRFDDAPVPAFNLVRLESQHSELEVQYYPKAGDPNPEVRFGVASVQSGEIVWVDEDHDKDQYSAWPFWAPDSQSLLIQEINRAQDTLKLVRVDPATGGRKEIYQETQDTWVEFFEDIIFLNNQQFIFRSNRDGWFNLYQSDLQGSQLVNLTPVPWRVTEIYEVDTSRREIYFYGTGPLSTDRHFYQVGFDGIDFKQITSAPGWHVVQPSAAKTYFADEYSSLIQAHRSQILDRKGKIVRELSARGEDVNARAGVKVEPLSIKTADSFDLPAFWVLPKGFDFSQQYPVVFTIYGGPDAGKIDNKYQDYSGDYYANHDIIKIVVDNRASGKFGKMGMDYLHRSLGKWEIDDLIAAVKWLRTLPYIDSTRIGITGSSYGGYVTCMAMTYGADFFTHGIALLPVTDWRLYDNVYAERYLDTPQENPEGYQTSSAINQAYKFKGKLLIVHGTMDDNVHMQNTIQFVSKLQDLGKDFEFMLYPGERHGWGGAKRSHLSMLTHNFWKKHFNLANTNIKP